MNDTLVVRFKSNKIIVFLFKKSNKKKYQNQKLKIIMYIWRNRLVSIVFLLLFWSVKENRKNKLYFQIWKTVK